MPAGRPRTRFVVVNCRGGEILVYNDEREARELVRRLNERGYELEVVPRIEVDEPPAPVTRTGR